MHFAGCMWAVAQLLHILTGAKGFSGFKAVAFMRADMLICSGASKHGISANFIKVANLVVIAQKGYA